MSVALAANHVVADLRGGRAVADTAFDRLYEPWVRELSEAHWTPVAAAAKAVEWLAPTAGQRVLDVGSGCGKFCLVGASCSPATFVGVERRIALVRAAQAVARALAIDRAKFIHADFASLPWRAFETFYFFNPFAEYLCGTGAPSAIDDSAPAQASLFGRAIQVVESRLAALPIGARIVCYNGYGGEMPKNFHVKQSERINDCYLRLWVKERRNRPARVTT